MDKEKKTEIHITNNFNAPIGQHIDHVDTINFKMDGDGTFHFAMVDNVSQEKKELPGEQLARAIESSQEYFWGNSSYAVLYCLYRDDLKREMPQTAFESMVRDLPYSKNWIMYAHKEHLPMRFTIIRYSTCMSANG